MAVIETGLGGRLDATNVLRPVLTMITDISLDHAEILGPTLKDIAGEKAGIIKTGVPNVIGPLPRAARTVIATRCRQLGSPLVALAPDEVRINRSTQTLESRIDGLRFRGLSPSLTGSHQLKNTALVLKAVDVLRRSGFDIRKVHVRAGLENTDWPGRFQLVDYGPALPTVVLDVCHNTGGGKAFVDTFKKTFRGRKAQTIVGFVRRKPHQELIDILASMTEQFWLVPLASKRSVDTIELLKTANWSGVPVRRVAQLRTAWRQVLKRTTGDDIVAVIGSHYLVGEFLSRYGG